MVEQKKDLLWKSFPILESSRLFLRQMHTEQDVKDLHQFWSDPQVCQYTNFLFETETRIKEVLGRLQQRFDAKEGIRWGITLKPDITIIGTIGFNTWEIDRGSKAEIGYDLSTSFWRQGIMSEALHLILDYGYSDMGLHRIEASVDPENVASRQLLEKNGFYFEGILRDHEYFKEAYHNSAIYSRLSTD